MKMFVTRVKALEKSLLFILTYYCRGLSLRIANVYLWSYIKKKQFYLSNILNEYFWFTSNVRHIKTIKMCLIILFNKTMYITLYTVVHTFQWYLLEHYHIVCIVSQLILYRIHMLMRALKMSRNHLSFFS